MLVWSDAPFRGFARQRQGAIVDEFRHIREEGGVAPFLRECLLICCFLAGSCDACTALYREAKVWTHLFVASHHNAGVQLLMTFRHIRKEGGTEQLTPFPNVS